MDILKYQSPNKTTGRSGWIPDVIVCHIAEGSFNGTISWLCNPQSGASTHFVIAKDGRIAQLVDVADTAWGNGTTLTPGDSRYYANSALSTVYGRRTSANNYTISIEHEGFYKDAQGALTEAQLNASAELISYIRSEVKSLYGRDIPVDRNHIVGHCDIAPRWKPNCPGQKFPYEQILKKIEEVGEVVDKTKINIDGTIYSVNRILKDGRNYVELQEFKQAGYTIGYDAATKIPSIAAPAKCNCSC